MHEEGWCAQFGPVCCAHLRLAFRRMQRVRQQQQSIRKVWICHGCQRRLPPAIRVAAEHDRTYGHLANSVYGLAESLLVFLCPCGDRRTGCSFLAKGQITAQDQEPRLAERPGEGDQQGSVAVAASTVSDYEAGMWFPVRLMNKASDCAFFEFGNHGQSLYPSEEPAQTGPGAISRCQAPLPKSRRGFFCSLAARIHAHCASMERLIHWRPDASGTRVLRIRERDP